MIGVHHLTQTLIARFRQSHNLLFAAHQLADNDPDLGLMLRSLADISVEIETEAHFLSVIAHEHNALGYLAPIINAQHSLWQCIWNVSHCNEALTCREDLLCLRSDLDALEMLAPSLAKRLS
ncbi:hypothetical protein LU196_14570 [Pantoea sp. Mb-10]|uniref:hypothetical protein n=1 Tax=unclassified Pantoea TaxID=2630326 RepID=UPI001E468679|nr:MULTISPECIES: hypothetical protein [unclassified Pantoea]MCE0491269.1 hypothetical protein [Pantoea sp. Mb-10]MCE0502758.1 hypothetical protein [Pantoea sp. Pb-8]